MYTGFDLEHSIVTEMNSRDVVLFLWEDYNNNIRKKVFVMKRLFKLLGVVGLMICFSACQSNVAIAKGLDEKDGVEVKVSSVHTNFISETKATEITQTVEISNYTDNEIMKVAYKLIYLDKDGKELKSISDRFVGENTPIKPGETKEINDTFKTRLDGDLAMVDVKIEEIKDTKEMEPIHLPEKGKPLYKEYGSDLLASLDTNKPTKIELLIDHGGDQTTYTLTSQEDIDKAVAAFKKVTIGEETYEFVTDNYNWISFTFADGQEVFISLNLYNMEYSGYEYHLYELDHLSEFLQCFHMDESE